LGGQWLRCFGNGARGARQKLGPGLGARMLKISGLHRRTKKKKKTNNWRKGFSEDGGKREKEGKRETFSFWKRKERGVVCRVTKGRARNSCSYSQRRGVVRVRFIPCVKNSEFAAIYGPSAHFFSSKRFIPSGLKFFTFTRFTGTPARD